MSTLTLAALVALVMYLAGAALFAAANHQYMQGGWWRQLKGALAWPALLVVLAWTWWRGD